MERAEGLAGLSQEQVKDSRLYCLRKKRENFEGSLIRYNKMTGFLTAAIEDMDREIKDLEKGV
jgi:hypothetical protein